MRYYFENEGLIRLNDYIKKSKPSKIVVITDTNTKQFCLPKLPLNHKFTNVNFEAGDVYKNIDTLKEIWEKLLSLGLDKKSLIINLGGGVVTDIGGFAASTFKRGVKFIHIPTTLLGMVDAAIGGKNGINFMGIKNQIGTIVQPEFVWIYSEFLKTLPKEEFDSGFAEMLKHGLIKDAGYWKELVDFYKNKTGSLSGLIKKSVEIKNTIIAEDPYEHGIRKFLNFGHTLGHAIESYLNYNLNQPITHGKSVAIGMILEAWLSYRVNGLSYNELKEIKANINSIYTRINFSTSDITEIINLMRYDKKNVNGVVKYVLLNKIGNADFDKEIPEDLIHAAFNYYLI